uniref:Ig-like domain-containing protein n=1 Tax=Sphaeramia orbicularis TaxID=375764 RepID=A0A673CHI3_9TELE
IKTVVNNRLSAVHSCRPLLTVSTCPPSGDRPLKPVVDVYQAASTAHLDGKTSLLCVASGMFPPEVRFSWKRQKGNGAVEDLPDAEGEQLEVQESGLFCVFYITLSLYNSCPLQKTKMYCWVSR